MNPIDLLAEIVNGCSEDGCSGDLTVTDYEPVERARQYLEGFKRINVLDRGFVELVDCMGDDNRICQAARVSTGRHTKERSDEENARLIDYLIRNRHTSPLEKVIFEFYMKMPIFVARQMIRHRTASVNEMSGRYREMPDEYWMPGEEGWRGQDTKNKQGSEGKAVYEPSMWEDAPGEFTLKAEDMAFREYHYRLAAGVSRELARTCLPLSTYTEWYWTMDLHNLLHFLELRLHPHAQEEIRVYAKAILELITPFVPMAIASWKNHVLNAVRFSEDELALLPKILAAVMDGKGPNEVSALFDHLTTSRASESAAKIHKLFKIMAESEKE